MKPEHFPSCFSPSNRRTDREAEDKAARTRLGNRQRIVQAMGVHIGVTAYPGKGAEFSLS